ncbi:GAF domain-containing sensor histidine kinase [Halomicroarcula sp. F13]|uniref:GAF domain-containing sensor histidine kinase n=1 Tax=Haloarcula rubra TaxID=2487747 RepID=A0AAW4PW13_9EURY|nr:GAF domain-containing sensor histidine kinase [Halomicroarcula rubra]MBX0324427.1 GAF domain-containing sensor histidine kinase [Halomicroarcula rubra]
MDTEITADTPTVLVGVRAARDRRLLVEWLSGSHDVVVLDGHDSLDDPFDAAIVDGQTYQTYRDSLDQARAGEYLPSLLVSRRDVSDLPPSVWRCVDDVIETPIRQQELEARIDGLLAHRRRFVELRRRNETIAALHDATQRMNDTADPERVCAIAVDAAVTVLNRPIATIWTPDESGTNLSPLAQTGPRPTATETASISADEGCPRWNAFVEGETRELDNSKPIPSTGLDGADRQRELVVPLDEFGLLTVGSTRARPFDDNEVYGAELLAAASASALDRAEREQMLAKTSSQMEFFNSIIRHDVLNAMLVIQARAETLSEQLEDDEYRQYAETIEKWSDDVVGVVQRVKSVVDTLTGDGTVDVEPIDLGPILEGELASVRSAYPVVDVEASAPAETTVLANELLSEVFANILRNTVVHNDPDGLSITVTVEKQGDCATVSIADTGTGIPDDEKDTIFRRGETGHAKSTGSGFGLFFVDTMVEAYGGRVRVEDNDPSGAVFVVRLPLANE